MKEIQEFIERVKDALDGNQFVKLTLSKARDKSSELRNVYGKRITIKAGERISFTFRYSTRDEVKNFAFDQLDQFLHDMLTKNFMVANLMTIEADYELLINKKGNMRLQQKSASKSVLPEAEHDRTKSRLIDSRKPHWFYLGITDRKGNVLPGMQHKFKQVNQYIDLLQYHLAPLLAKPKLQIVDMGAGKGYLTFALYEFLVDQKGILPDIVGVEQRPELVKEINLIARKSQLSGLRFVEGTINDFTAGAIDVLIALHACDTATDDAIASGIKAGAELIVCAPCCHKQIRKEITASAQAQPMLKYGIILEKQAELLTDTLRALLMEKYGYTSHIQEFIEAEHTPKNLLLTGIKSQQPANEAEVHAKIQKLKYEFGIKSHHLETLLETKP